VILSEVYAPFKIFSLLIRGLDAELKMKNNKAKGNMGNHKKDQDDIYDEDGRLDTVGDDDLYDFKDGDDGEDDGDGEEWQDEEKLEVDLEIQKDEDYSYLEKRFNVKYYEKCYIKRFKMTTKGKD
jgi:hypothetical protein